MKVINLQNVLSDLIQRLRSIRKRHRPISESQESLRSRETLEIDASNVVKKKKTKQKANATVQ